MRVPVAILGAGLIFGGGMAVGSMISLQEPARTQGAAPSSPAASVPPAVRAGTGPDARPLEDVSRELSRLAAEVAQLREAVSAAALPAGTGGEEENGLSKEARGAGIPGAFRFVLGGGDDEKGEGDFAEEQRRRQYESLGLQEPARASLETQLAMERAQIQERFAARVDLSAWEEYRALKSRGWHRLTPEDHRKLQEMDGRFKTIQEEVLRQWKDAAAYQGLSPSQREGVESMRGGRLGVASDGGPRVEDGAAGGMSFVYRTR